MPLYSRTGHDYSHINAKIKPAALAYDLYFGTEYKFELTCQKVY